jgi:hypothetical protein
MIAMRCALFAVVLTMPTIASAQSPAPDVLRELLVEVRGLRAVMERAATVGARIQLLVARVQMQEQRIAEASRRAITIRDQISSIEMQSAQLGAMVKQFEGAAAANRASPDEQREFESMIEMQKQQFAASEKRKQELIAEEALLSQQIALDQSRWSDVNNQLDELERSLTPRKQD